MAVVILGIVHFLFFFVLLLPQHQKAKERDINVGLKELDCPYIIRLVIVLFF
jgi:hypothetical protein